MSETEKIEPFENTLGVPMLRTELRRAWDENEAILKDLWYLPVIPSIVTLGSFLHSSSWLDFNDARKIAIQMQREHGLEAIPPKCEYELAAAHYKFIRDAILEKVARDSFAVSEPCATAVAEAAELYIAHLEEHDIAMKVGGYVPLDDDYPVQVPLRILRLAHEALPAPPQSPAKEG